MEIKESFRQVLEERDYYKGFYEGVKEITTFLGDGPIDINHNVNVKGLEDEQIKETNSKEKNKMKVAVGKIEGEKAKEFIKMMEELRVE